MPQLPELYCRIVLEQVTVVVHQTETNGATGVWVNGNKTDRFLCSIFMCIYCIFIYYVNRKNVFNLV